MEKPNLLKIVKISKLFSELPKSERIRYVTYFPGLMKDGYIKNHFDENDSDYKKYSSEYRSNPGIKLLKL